MNAVGIDISKGKSMVAVLHSSGQVLLSPFEVHHTSAEITSLIHTLSNLDGDTKIVMEYTGRYYEPIASRLSASGLFVSIVNPRLIRGFGNNSLRRVKTDKADAVKIARYTLSNWNTLTPYSSVDELRSQLKIMNRQFDFYMKQKITLKNNLVSLLDQTFPGVNGFFDSPARSDGSQKWVDFASTYWHADCVRGMSLSSFTEHYCKWCKKHAYRFQEEKAAKIYDASKNLITVFPKDTMTKMFIRQAIEQLNSSSRIVELLRDCMNDMASRLPEYPVVMEMRGVGPSLGPQLMAEIGDVRRFSHKNALTAFAGVDPGANQSGAYEQQSVRTSKRGSSQLRKTLFQVMDVLIKTCPKNDPVYDFMDRKRTEGKSYYVYMTAGANKFLRIYYGRVREYMASLPPET